MSNRVKMTGPSDVGKRIADQYSLHRVADPHGSIGKWFAVTLHDGTSDGTLYDTKQQCIRHQKQFEMYYAYIQVTPAHMTPKYADTFIDLHRRMYDKGIRMADPDASNGGRDVIRRLTETDQRNQTRSITVGDRPPSNLIIPGRNTFR